MITVKSHPTTVVTSSQASKRAEKAAAARAEYVRTAQVRINVDYALVIGAGMETYEVLHDGQYATDCPCDDRYYRHGVCKHMEVTNIQLAKCNEPLYISWCSGYPQSLPWDQLCEDEKERQKESMRRASSVILDQIYSL